LKRHGRACHGMTYDPLVEILALSPRLTDLEEAAIWVAGDGDILAKSGIRLLVLLRTSWPSSAAPGGSLLQPVRRSAYGICGCIRSVALKYFLA
jgi:hypothetical protein